MKAAERKEEVKGCVSAGVGMWGREEYRFPRCLEKEAPPRRGGAAGAGGGGEGGEEVEVRQSRGLRLRCER